MKVRAITHQAAARNSLAPAISCRYRSPGRERHDLFAVGEEETISTHKQCVYPLLNNFPEGLLDRAGVAGIEEHQLHAERARGSLHLPGLGLCKYWVCWVAQVSNGLRARDQSNQELEAFRGHLGEEKIDASEISIGMAETVDEADPHVNALGAKGLGEVAMTGVTGAVANAIFNATGLRVRDLPITLDKLI